MTENPYESSEATHGHILSGRLRRGRFMLGIMACLITLIVLSEVGMMLWQSEWNIFPILLIRLVLPLGLLYAIWKGHQWARLALIGWVGVIVYSNLDLLTVLESLLAKSQYGHVLYGVLFIVDHALIAALALFSPAIRGLLAYRLEERDMR